MLHVHVSSLCCMSMLHVHAALSMLHTIPHVHAAGSLHVGAACPRPYYISILHAMLHLNASCPGFMSLRHVHAAYPCFLSTVLTYAEGPCCFFMLLVHASWPWVHAACSRAYHAVYQAAWPYWMNITHEHAQCCMFACISRCMFACMTVLNEHYSWTCSMLHVRVHITLHIKLHDHTEWTLLMNMLNAACVQILRKRDQQK
jgi:hypothetical protein